MDDLDKIRKLKIEEIGKISVFYVDRDKKLAIKSTKSLRHGYDNNFIFSGYATKSLKKLVYLIKNNNNYQKSDFFSDKRFLLEITMWDQSSTEFFIDLDCKYLEIGDSEYEIKNNDVKNEYNYILRKYFLLK
ncbi:hypothetical protein [Armatimonas rosea]|uniref:Uncharacterized protein n=1 Tax=Armatimonas rosea TaxID=685828 RepID=A0A7W9WAZ0_ARMRO|nr:hypothetical protein [Armatimonas rosea]MBB6054107.1 hypothetical protein [Armatimonas rosea]